MPHPASFPSGHTASGLAFANAVEQTLPMATAPLRLLAGVVGYSRLQLPGALHEGCGFMGAVIGASIDDLVGWGLAGLRLPGAWVR